MFKNYLKIAIRNMMKFKTISLINIVSLSIGLAIVMLVLLNAHFQFSFDECHEKLDRIYQARMGSIYATPTALADYVREKIPEVENSVRFEDWEGRKVLLTYKDQSFIVRNIIFTDPSVFDVFSFKIIAGDAKTALTQPWSLVLSESEAKKLFGFVNPVGKVVRYNSKHDYTITAVVEDTPVNASHIYGGFAPFKDPAKLSQDWDGWYYDTYFLLAKNQNAAEVEKKVKSLIEQFFIEHDAKDAAANYPVSLSPMKNAYFNPEMGGNYRHGNKPAVFLFMAIGLFILCLAILNYVNLTTARATTRLKEIAIRKTVGSHKRQLVTQFLFESILVSLAAAGFGILLLELSLPFVNRFTASAMGFSPFSNPVLLLLIFGGATLVGGLAGILPSFYLTGIGTTRALKGAGLRFGKGLNLRRALIMFQFSVSIILLIATLTIMKQRKFIQTKDLGFDKEQIVWFDLNDAVQKKKEMFRDLLMKNPDILNVAYTRFNEADANNSWGGKYEGREVKIHPFWVDANYVSLMGLKVIEGRDFSEEMTTDLNQAIILNQTAVRQFGLESPVGKKLFGRTVIGIVQDFNYQSLHHKIEPLGLIPLPGVNKANVKIAAANVPVTLRFIDEQWKTLSPDYPFEYHFLDESYAQLYESEKKTGTLFNFFSLMALFIACLGLFGLAAFSAEQRTKEIGIRKVLGASVTNLVLVLSKDFTGLVVIANLFAWPIAWYAINKWLQNFAYHIEVSWPREIAITEFLKLLVQDPTTGLNFFFSEIFISQSWWMFALAGGLALVIALLTVSWQAVRAAMANPVEALRYE